MRTLEQKISDAGPTNQRVQPHILTGVRNTLLEEKVIRRSKSGSVPWFFRAGEDPKRIKARLAELQPIMARFTHGALTVRVGQALEIACYRAMSEADDLRVFGAFRDLDAHDDATLYSKEEPPSTMGKRSIGNENLDFIAFAGAVPLGVEVKNIREWLYPDRTEVRDALRKALALDVVPVLVARRIPYVTYRLLSGLGVIMHETYNQLLPAMEAELADLVRDKNLLGYHDVRTGNEPDARLLHFFQNNLPALADEARFKFQKGRDLLEPFATRAMGYKEFAARVRRREKGQNEDHDWEDSDESGDPNDAK